MKISRMMEMVLLFRIRMIPFMRNVKKDRRDGKKERINFDFFYNYLGCSF
jgi:hypothetical protein